VQYICAEHQLYTYESAVRCAPHGTFLMQAAWLADPAAVNGYTVTVRYSISPNVSKACLHSSIHLNQPSLHHYGLALQTAPMDYTYDFAGTSLPDLTSWMFVS
jgi:hypothetical protein